MSSTEIIIAGDDLNGFDVLNPIDFTVIQAVVDIEVGVGFDGEQVVVGGGITRRAWPQVGNGTEWGWPVPDRRWGSGGAWPKWG